MNTSTKSSSSRVTFHIPTRPYSPIDAHNRLALATGGVQSARYGSHADYNGHHVTLSWNDYRGYYVAEYFWAGRVVLARGTFDQCLRAVLEEHARGALGSSAAIYVPADAAEALRLARACPELTEGALPSKTQTDWWTWRHDVGTESARDSAFRGMYLIFDWTLCQATNNREEYEEALLAKYGKAYA